MTTEERFTRLEGMVEKMATDMSAFVRSATECNATVTTAIASLSEAVQSQGVAIRRLEEMVTRFDEWLRGQGPRDGHER
jgi:hypothetical protein